MPIMSTNFHKTLAWKHEYDVKLWRHKERTPNTNHHHISLNEPPPVKIFCLRHCRPVAPFTQQFCDVRGYHGKAFLRAHLCWWGLVLSLASTIMRQSLHLKGEAMYCAATFLTGQGWRCFWPLSATNHLQIRDAKCKTSEFFQSLLVHTKRKAFENFWK